MAEAQRQAESLTGRSAPRPTRFAATIAFIILPDVDTMPTQPDYLDEFLRKVDPLIQSPPLYKSLDFACVAAKVGTEWIIISGKAVLNAEPCASDAQIAPLVRLDELIAFSGRIQAKAANDLAANLRDSWVLRGLKQDNVRLTGEGVGGYSWTMPGVYLADKSWNPSSRWGKAFALYGSSMNPSSTIHSTLQEVDSQLRRSTPAFSGFDGLCGKLGLPVRRSNLTPGFQLSAELPARFANVQTDSAKGALVIDVECIGCPELMVDWLPQHDFRKVPPDWKMDSADNHHHFSIAVPCGATKAELVLSFAGLDADTRAFDIVSKSPSTTVSVRKGVPNREHERWRIVGKSLGTGGQGQVFVVEDTLQEYEGQWALKRLKNIHDQKGKQRFGQEVKAVQSINHPNILNVIHSDLTAERPYFVAEYCRGGSLQTIGASRYQGDILATMRVLLPILEAVVAAHQAGVIHRDIKPANILFRKDETPVIGDFGICFLEGSEGLTSVDEAVGPRHFIAPEMESGGRHLGPPTEKTDVYSVGKLLYWLLSGGLYLDRERHRLNSLVKLLNEQRWEHVHSLLDKMVTERPEDRLQSGQLKEQLQTVASLVEGNFAPLSPSVGIRCRFCGIGTYKRTSLYAGPHSFKHIGLTSRSHVDPSGKTALLTCVHCGHIEWFQLEGIKYEGWWER